jgi:hypothetical protein
LHYQAHRGGLKNIAIDMAFGDYGATVDGRTYTHPSKPKDLLPTPQVFGLDVLERSGRIILLRISCDI